MYVLYLLVNFQTEIRENFTGKHVEYEKIAGEIKEKIDVFTCSL
jgi:hypothetical protein